MPVFTAWDQKVLHIIRGGPSDLFEEADTRVEDRRHFVGRSSHSASVQGAVGETTVQPADHSQVCFRGAAVPAIPERARRFAPGSPIIALSRLPQREAGAEQAAAWSST